MKGLWFSMHYSTRRRVALGLTTGGLLMTGLGMTTAQADTGAAAAGDAAGSPGVGSGNVLQIPINLPVNLCGNQVDVVGILDSVAGNSCSNGGARTWHAPGSESPRSHAPGSGAQGASYGSPGIGSGNLIQIPVNAPVNICGNQLDVVGVGNSDRGNSCVNRGAGGGASAAGSGAHSPGILAGNVIQVPLNAPVNVCGNQVGVIAVLDSVIGNNCANGGPGGPHHPPVPAPVPVPGSTPPSGATPPSTGCTCTPPSPHHHHHHGSSTTEVGGHPGASAGSGSSGGMLAHTGTSVLEFAPFGAGLLSGGVLLKRKLPTRQH